VYRRRYESRRSSKTKLHFKKNMAKKDFQYGGWNSYTLHPGMTCHWIRPNIRHIGILHLVSISTIWPQLTCHSAPVCEILSKSDDTRQKKVTSCRFSRWRISAILDFRDPIMATLKSQCTTSYRSSIETIALNCLGFEEIAFFGISASRSKKLSNSKNYKKLIRD